MSIAAICMASQGCSKDFWFELLTFSRFQNGLPTRVDSKTARRLAKNR